MKICINNNCYFGSFLAKFMRLSTNLFFDSRHSSHRTQSFRQLQHRINSSFICSRWQTYCAVIRVVLCECVLAGTITGYMIKCQDMMTTNTFSENCSTSQWLPVVKMITTKCPNTNVRRQKALLKWTICNLEYYFRILFMRFHFGVLFVMMCSYFCSNSVYSPFESVIFAGWVLLFLSRVCVFFFFAFDFVVHENVRTHFWFVLCAIDAHSFPLFASIVQR